MPIRVLPPEVVDQIAAGEVVERPAHLLKELIENSLDAGATRIEVAYGEGGRRVRVTDDGGGLAPDELPLALERFATSKIAKADDLWSLSSFGFRGEALASIAAVSRLTLTSRQPKAKQASKLVCEFGKRGDVETSGGSPGTTVSIEELFGNLPARLKFLKTEAAEHAQIRVLLKALALAHPGVEFRVHENEKLLFYFPASDPVKRASQVLEVDELYTGEAQREGVRARAIFAAPSDVSRTSKNIWVFAQNRWVQDRSLTAAVMEAYRSLLMHGEYPIAAVWVETEPSEIDVNIHPTKSQVKFREPSLAFRAVQAAVRETLERAPWIPGRAPTQESGPAPFGNREPESLKFDDPALRVHSTQKKNFDLQFRDSGTSNYSVSSSNSISSSNRGDDSAPTLLSPDQVTGEEISGGYWSSLEVLGQANQTYILCENDQGLVLVDQHAAHERVVFEKLMKAWRGGTIDVQDFLFPLAVDLSPEKVEALGTVAADLEKLGVHIEVLGPGSIGVKAGPAILRDSVYAAVLEKMSQDIVDRGGSFHLEKIIGDVCATLACHSVVRAGQTLSREQMQSLLKSMDEFPLSSFCPHGRPVSVTYPFNKLEKDFGRIV